MLAPVQDLLTQDRARGSSQSRVGLIQVMQSCSPWKGKGSIAKPCFGLEPDAPTTRAAKRSVVPGRVPTMRRRLPERAKGSRGDRSALLQEKSEQTEVELLLFSSLQFADASRKALESRKNTVNAALTCVSETEYPLTAEALEKLAARFRTAGYRSGFQYLLTAKREHIDYVIELWHRWTEQL